MARYVIRLLEACLNSNPKSRPSSFEIEKMLKKHLLHNKHRALLVAGDKEHELHQGSLQANIVISQLGNISIKYTGTEFVIVSHAGTVKVNNVPVREGMELPGCCVITFGVGSYRWFVTCDVSNPEVMP